MQYVAFFWLKDNHNDSIYFHRSVTYVCLLHLISLYLIVFICSFLCLPKETEPKKGHPGKPLYECVRSPRKNPLAINSLCSNRNCSSFGFPLDSLTGFQGAPFWVLKFNNSEKIPYVMRLVLFYECTFHFCADIHER